MRQIGCKRSMVVCSIAGLLSCFISPQGLAKGYCPVKNTWFLSVGAGGASIGMPSLTSVDNGSGATPPMNLDTYTIGDASATLTQLELGYRWHQKKNFIPYTNLSLQYKHYMNANINGTIDQYTLPGFVNYNYQIRYGADMFVLNAKIDLIERRKIMPYVSGGLGVSLTHINDYTETPTSGVTARFSPDFQGNTIKRLVATVGAGLDYIVTDTIWLTLGYEHTFQSSLKSGAGTGSWSPAMLNLGNPSMDTFFLSLTANIPGAIRS